MKQFKGFIFDMDGVVVDNHEFHFKAWMEFAKKYKYPLTADIYREKFNGKKNEDLFPMIFGSLKHSEIESYSQEKEKIYQALYLPHMKATKGLVDFLDYLVGKGHKIALGTSAPTGNVDFVLDKLFLRRYFDVIVDGPQVLRGKPDPMVYQLCADKLGLPTHSCVVFEDSLAGLESGRNAGCSIVGVATSHRPNELNHLTAEIIFDFTDGRKKF